jgi:hypothetical protein
MSLHPRQDISRCPAPIGRVGLLAIQRAIRDQRAMRALRALRRLVSGRLEFESFFESDTQ